jgi:predicted Zn-dependent protease
MKEGTLDRQTFEAIEAYVLERMSEHERAAFEQRMASDPSLQAEVQLERENIQAIELGGLSRMLKGIAQEEPMDVRGATPLTTYLKYAAMVAAIVTGTIWWMSRTPINEQLYAEYFTPDPGLPVSMGITGDPAFADAMVAYKLGDYAEARTKWATLHAKEPVNDTLRYYIASAWLAENNTARAIPLLEELVKEPGSTFRARAHWFLFLSYLRIGDTARARAMAPDKDPAYGERVRAILVELER